MRPSAAVMAQSSSNSFRIGSTSSSVSTSTSGSAARSTSIEVLPVGTATQRAPIERAQRTSFGVSPITTSSRWAVPLRWLRAGGECRGGDVVAVGVLVAKAAEGEPVPEFVVTQLVLGRLARRCR